MPLIVVLVLGSIVGFGGAVWWFRPVLAVAAFLLVAFKLMQQLLAGEMRILKSPLTLLGLLALGLGVSSSPPCPRTWQAASRPQPMRPIRGASSPTWFTRTIPRRAFPRRLRFGPRQAWIGPRRSAG